jgi:biopolymer transport protein ExbD
MITKPLELESRLSPPPRDLDFVAWVNVVVIVLFFGLLGSRFILSPGVGVQIGDARPVLDLPTAGSAASGATSASVVVSYRRDNVILFEGGMYSLADLRKQLEGYVRNNPSPVMLLRMDKQVTMQAFFDFTDMAKEVGFINVFVATESQHSDSGLGN